MSVKQTLRWALVYRALSAVAFVVGFGVFAVGLALALEFDPIAFFEGDLAGAFDGESPLVGGLVALVGLVVWRVGTAAALYYTLSGAVEERMSRRFDSEKVKSDILSVLDDRLAGMEEQVQATRSDVREVAEAQGGNQFQFDEGR